MALKLGIQTYQILTNDDEVCIPSLSSILLAVSNHYDMIISDLYKLQVTLILRSSAAFFEYISSNRPASQKDRSWIKSNLDRAVLYSIVSLHYGLNVQILPIIRDLFHFNQVKYDKN